MARKPLGPKPVPAIVPVALKLKELGYRPLPLRSGKSTPTKGWKLEPNTVEEIGQWRGRTLAVWMQASDDLFAVDLDVQIQEVLDRIIARYQKRWPEFMDRCLIRHSDAVKVMLIGRLTTDKKHVYTARYGAEVVKGGNRVELFTSNDPGYIAVWGEHSKGRMYGYDGVDILQQRLADLPEFPDVDLNELLTIAIEEMEAAGLQKTETASSGIADIAFDLEPDRMAELTDGRQMTLQELEAEADGQWVYLHGRLFDPDTETANRCKAKVTSQGLTIWDFGTSIVHYWKHLGPQTEVLAPLLAKLAADVAAAGGGIGGAGETSMFGKWLPPGVKLSDFYAFMPAHKYLFIPTGDLWPAASIDGRLPAIGLTKADGTPILHVRGAKKGEQKYQLPSLWLDKNRPVEQMTWAPGHDAVIKDQLVTEAGWCAAPGMTTFNRYRPPTPCHGNADDIDPWLDLLEKLYPGDAAHVCDYFAHRIQKPEEKINHGLVFVGVPGIGKDTIIEPLRVGVGPWNFKEASPHDIVGAWNGYMNAVMLRISEARDLGDINRYAMHDKMKTILAGPPDTAWINTKFVPQYYIVNVCGTVITTNHKYDGIFLPADDRRHYVCGTEVRPEDFAEGYWVELWKWYAAGGIENVVSYLAEHDISKFDAKAPPKKTEAFWQIVGAGVAPEVAELTDALEALNVGGVPPVVITLSMVERQAKPELRDWLKDRKNRRLIPHRMESAGYVPVHSAGTKDGRWVIGKARQTVYGQRDKTPAERLAGITELVSAAAKYVEEQAKRDASPDANVVNLREGMKRRDP